MGLRQCWEVEDFIAFAVSIGLVVLQGEVVQRTHS